MTEEEKLSNDGEEKIEVPPINVKVISEPKEEEEDPTSWEEVDIYNYTPTEEEIKEMTNAQ